MAFQQRDIVLVHFPFTDLTQTKLRPPLILSANHINALSDFVCVQITSKPLADSSYLQLTNDMLEGSLLLASGVRLHKIFCLHENLIVHKIAELTPFAFAIVLDTIHEKVFTVRR
jgi:mRNA interferase MazF